MTRLGIAIGGLSYSIDEYLPKGFNHYRPSQWPRIQREIENHRGPVTIIGFSWGAEWAIKFLRFDKVDRIFAHSPGDVRFPDYSPNKDITILATTEDRLCYDSALKAYAYLSTRSLPTRFKAFPFQEFVPKTLAERVMYKNRHQFSNAVPFLEEEGWGMRP